jgi:nuclear mRNA export protein PCID2/THP1
MVNAQATKQALKNAVMNEDAQGFARVFVLPPIGSSSSSSSSSPQKHQPQSFNIGDSDYGGLLVSLLDAIAAAEAGDASSCFEAQVSLHSHFNRLYATSEGNWFVPALMVVCKNTSSLSQQAGDTQNRAPNVLQESFSRSVNDRAEYDPHAPFDNEGSKKAAALGIVNELFAMYFRMNQLRLCKTLIRPLEQKKLHLNGSMSDMVTYRYYQGRLLMFEDQHAAAEESLEYAFRHCHKDSIHNKRCILKYLVPVKLVQGKVPTPQRT